MHFSEKEIGTLRFTCSIWRSKLKKELHESIARRDMDFLLQIPARKWQSESEQDEEEDERLHDVGVGWEEKATEMRRSITTYDKRLEEIRIRLNEIKKVKRSAVADVLAEKEALLAEDGLVRKKRYMYNFFRHASQELARGYAKVVRAREEMRYDRDNIEANLRHLQRSLWLEPLSEERRAALKRLSEPNDGGAEALRLESAALKRLSGPNEWGGEVEDSFNQLRLEKWVQSSSDERRAALARLSEPNEEGAQANDGGAEVE